MASFGVLPEGFVEKTLQDVVDEIEDAEKSSFGAGTDVAPDAPLGQLNGVFGDQIAEMWELAGAIYRALYPDSAENESLDNISSITGTIRLAPSATIVTLSLNLDPGVTVPVGSIVRNSVTGDRFVTTTEGFNPFMDQANIQVQAVAESTGPIEADAYSIDEIVTPISGWTAQAAVDSGSVGPFNISFNDTLNVKIDNETTAQVLVFEATPAVITSGNTETFALADGQTLLVDVDGGGAVAATFNAQAAALENGIGETYALANGQVLSIRVDGGAIQNVTMNTGDFVAIVAATAEEVRDVINAQTTGLVASATSGGTRVTLTSLKVGTGSGIEVTGGTANAALQFSTTPVSGSGEFFDIALATAAEVAAVIDTDIAGLSTAAVAGAVEITSDTLGDLSSLEVTGGTAAAALGFPGGVQVGAQDFTDFSNVSAADMAAAIDSKLVGGEAAALSSDVVRMQSETNGPGSSIEVTGGTAQSALNYPTTRVAGLNQLDEDQLGRNLETDNELRLRRLQELRAQGNATFEAIRSDLLLVPGVLEVFLLENDTNVINAEGLPPHSFEAIVNAPTSTDQDIADAIFETKAAGIRAHGVTTVVVQNSQGDDHDIGFTRATEVEIYADITVSVNTDPSLGPVYPGDGDEQIKAAIVAEGDDLGIGDDVIFEKIKCAAFEVTGVTDITSFFIDVTASPTGTANIPIGPRDIARFDTSRVTVTSS